MITTMVVVGVVVLVGLVVGLVVVLRCAPNPMDGMDVERL